MAAPRRSTRLKNTTKQPVYNAQSSHMAVKFHDLYASGNILKMKFPIHEAQKKFPYGIVTKVDGEQQDK